MENEWEKFEKQLNEYFDDQHPWSCDKLAKRRRRKLFEKPDKDLLYPIHHAVWNNNMFVLKKLVDDFGCDINIPICDYDTVLILAARARSIWEGERIQGTAVSTEFDIFPNIEENPKPNIISYLLDIIYADNPKAINKRDDEHRTVLHHAILHHRTDYVKWLIKAGADIKPITVLKATVLHFACFSPKGDEECLEILQILTPKDKTLDNKLILQKNSDGLTAVCLAAQ